MQIDSCGQKAGLAIALVALLVGTGCAGYGTGSSKAPALNTYAYVTQQNTSTGGWSIGQFQVASDGTFTPLNPASFTIDASGYSLTVDPSGNYAFTEAANTGQTPGTIYQFTVGSDGTLANNSVPTVSTSSFSGGLVFAPNGHFAVAANGNSLVSSYALGPTGSLSLVNTVLAGFGPNSIAIDATGKYAYVTAGGLGYTQGFTLTEYSISESGALNLVVTYPIWLNPGALVLSPKGFLYLSEYNTPSMGGLPGAIVVFSIDETNGGLSVAQTYATSDRVPGPVIFDQTGTYAYVGNGNSLTISQFTVDQTTGVLTQNAPDSIGYIGQTSGAVDPSGKFLYWANQGQNNVISPQVSRLAINADGTLAPTSPATSLGSDEYPSVIAIAQH